MSDFDVDLFVIGGGSGGVRAARIAAGYGAKVMIAEEYRFGGTCVIRGCVPKKLYAYASRFHDDFEDARGFGWSFPGEPVFDWPTLVAAKEREVTRLSGLYRGALEGAGVTMVETRAIVLGPHQVRLERDARLVSAKTILVSVGASPHYEPKIEGMDYAISSNEIFDLPQCPQRLLIVGGGYISVEFASVFARLGAKVDLAIRADMVLRGFDNEMRAGAMAALTEAGVTVHPHVMPTQIDRTAEGLNVSLSSGASIVADQALVATGRFPNTKGLGLEGVGVALDEIGSVKVDAWSRSTVPSIYAIGDVTDRLNLTPVAIREGHAFADTVFGGKQVRVDHKDVATAVFMTPELGTVGLTEEQAREQFDVVDIYRANFRPMKATLSGRSERTIMKIIVDGATDRVLGVHVLGHDAGEMAQLLGIAVKMGAKKADFDATMAVHPTAAEELVTLRTRSARHERGK